MKNAVETFENLLAKHGENHYGKTVLNNEYSLYVMDETDTRFILSNGSGESVSDERDINIQFMMMKDVLGFESIANGEYQLKTSKFNDHLRFNGLKLAVCQAWLVRVAIEEDDAYLIFTNGSAPDGWEPIPGTNFNVKWVPKSEVTEVLDFITGPKFNG